MVIKETKVLITLHNQTIRHYEEKGYEIPRRRTKWGDMSTPPRTKILVKVEDLTDGSDVRLTKI